MVLLPQPLNIAMTAIAVIGINGFLINDSLEVSSDGLKARKVLPAEQFPKRGSDLLILRKTVAGHIS